MGPRRSLDADAVRPRTRSRGHPPQRPEDGRTLRQPSAPRPPQHWPGRHPRLDSRGWRDLQRRRRRLPAGPGRPGARGRRNLDVRRRPDGRAGPDHRRTARRAVGRRPADHAQVVGQDHRARYRAADREGQAWPGKRPPRRPRRRRLRAAPRGVRVPSPGLSLLRGSLHALGAVDEIAHAVGGVDRQMMVGGAWPGKNEGRHLAGHRALILRAGGEEGDDQALQGDDPGFELRPFACGGRAGLARRGFGNVALIAHTTHLIAISGWLKGPPRARGERVRPTGPSLSQSCAGSRCWGRPG